MVEAVMTILDQALWTAKIFLGGWTEGGGEDILVREPATGPHRRPRRPARRHRPVAAIRWCVRLIAPCATTS
jgi:hypothetical protein